MMIQATPAPISTTCRHCALHIPAERVDLPRNADPSVPSPADFCCSGCEYVYAVINGHGLGKFYELRAREGAAAPGPATPSKDSFEHFDHEAFRKSNVTYHSESEASVLFSLSGVHCTGCVWLLEKLPTLCPGVTNARVNFALGTVSVSYSPVRCTLSSIARTLDSFGYTPRPGRIPDTAASTKRERIHLIRLGVAAVCAMQTMMIAVSLYQGLYSGIEARYESFLSWVSLLVTIPSVFYAATPFYKTSISALRARTLHIDIPISVAVIGAFFASALNTILGRPDVYYDSITALIFLLLGARYLQERWINKARAQSMLLYQLTPEKARVIEGTTTRPLPIEGVIPGMEILVFPGEKIPVDGIVTEGSSQVDSSLLTGESTPVSITTGSSVSAGTINLGGEIRVRAERTGTETRVAGIVRLVEEASNRRAPIVDAAQAWSKYFVGGVLTLSVATFFYWLDKGLFIAIDRTMALLIVTCPCALGLATPLTFVIACGKAARRGIIIRGGDAIQRTAASREIFFDKTGTITEGRVTVVDHALSSGGAALGATLWQEVARVEGAAQGHAIGRALFNFACEKVGPMVQLRRDGSAQSVTGVGVSGVGSDGATWFIGKSTALAIHDLALQKTVSAWIAAGHSPVIIARNNDVCAAVALGDPIKAGVPDLVETLTAQGRSVRILSGDLPAIVTHVGTKVGIPPSNCFGGCLPEDKVSVIKRSSLPTAMIGDGINDAPALRAAGVGVGVHGGAEAALSTADIYLSKSTMGMIDLLFVGADQTMKIVYRNLIFAATYNTIGATGAIIGLVDPLAAALLMPLSSLTVVSSCLLGKSFEPERK